MKVRDDQMCSYCNDIVDYIEHFFFDCPTIKKFWNYIELYIVITFDIQTYLTVVDVLFGIKQHNCGKGKTRNADMTRKKGYGPSASKKEKESRQFSQNHSKTYHQCTSKFLPSFDKPRGRSDFAGKALM